MGTNNHHETQFDAPALIDLKRRVSTEDVITLQCPHSGCGWSTNGSSHEVLLNLLGHYRDKHCAPEEAGGTLCPACYGNGYELVNTVPKLVVADCSLCHGRGRILTDL